jgi:IPT/TIG domain-containing protein
MLRLNTFLLGVLLICELGCGTSTQPTNSPNQSGNNATPQAAASAPLIASISPVSVPAGSPDLTLTITGSKFDNKFLGQSIAFWTTDPNNLHDHGKMLFTTFVSSNQLAAVIPAPLLQNPTMVQIVVLTGDSMGMSDGFFGYPKSNAVTFNVTP